ncbi:hypothetical protein L204_105127 [Cryptococcus depauperatus]|uniref:Putative OHCU decarboxylase protein n=1 Tax=Cryptococcus depauperatus TaxID=5208 RepID=D2JWU0_9TREE|nr:putative OHCU decarboxylase protein [Cryptococcus depauperatus]ODN96085.1 hypothetical protein L204_03776 [Cryptococcus depauperatus CBS 7855]
MIAPPLSSINDTNSLTLLLSLLFEPSPPLHSLLVPSVVSRLSNSSLPQTYSDVVDLCAKVAEAWTWEQKGQFINGHPMIGEVKGLSKLSGKEQGNGGPTPEKTLDRLAHLNQVYCKVYPGLRYITFVNGRTKAQIIPEFESTLGLSASPNDPYWPAIESEVVLEKIQRPEEEGWRRECERGLRDVWLIGKARLKALGLE